MISPKKPSPVSIKSLESSTTSTPQTQEASELTRRRFLERASMTGVAIMIPVACGTQSTSTTEDEMTGGQATGGQATGGQATGGQATGGQATGGQMTGGQMTGGEMTGGQMTGGQMTGGQMTGGQMTGGQMTGGEMTGGEMTGGEMTGGEMTGGEMTGGQMTGGEMTGGQCEVTAPQIQGPYYFDPGLNRAEIHEGRSGAPLTLNLMINHSEQCVPLEGALVEVWHADAVGLYSGYDGQAEDTRGETFLRGALISDVDGYARFQTIYPGWYPGRAVHIHFKVTSNGFTELVSQLYFPDEISRQVYGGEVYRVRGVQDTLNTEDRFLLGAGDLADGLVVEVRSLDVGYEANLSITLSPSS